MYTREEAIAKAKSNNRDCKIAREHLNAWYYSSAKELGQVYGRYSENKKRAFDYCKEMVRQYGGYDYNIISANCMVFTFGFIFKDNDGKNIFAYITRDYDRFAYIDC